MVRVVGQVEFTLLPVPAADVPEALLLAHAVTDVAAIATTAIIWAHRGIRNFRTGQSLSVS
jgi:hypothetical protein